MTAPRSFTLLVNPAAGGGAAGRVVLPLARALRDAGARVEVTWSPGPEAVAGLVGTAVARDDVVVAVGGDGMVSAVAGPVADSGGTLGVLPVGRGNDFARMLGLPADPAAVAERLLTATPRRVDLLEACGPAGRRLVAGSVYAGVDARAAEHVAAMRRVPQRLQYPVAAVRALASYTPAHHRLTLDGQAHEFRAATVVVANSGYYGNGMLISPSSVVDDGLLDVVVIEAASRWQLIRSLPKVYDGRHVDLAEVTVLRGVRVELTATAPGGVPVGGDGEPLGTLAPGHDRLAVAVCPGGLALLG